MLKARNSLPRVGMAALMVLGFVTQAHAVDRATSLPSETPATFTPQRDTFDYVKREEMIPMRDGVKLLTVIWAPKRSSGPMPIVITRTPYDAEHRTAWTHRPNSPTATAAVPIPDAPLLANGYIRVYQDVRGKYGSEGNYVMSLPPRGPLNPGPVDQSTDAWDTVTAKSKRRHFPGRRVWKLGNGYAGFSDDSN